MNPSAVTSAWSYIRLGVHLLVGVLLCLVVFRAFLASGSSATAVTPVAALMAVTYLLGLAPAVRRSRRLSLGWLAVVVVVWLVLLVLSPEAIWLAFPLFFLVAHLLPQRSAVAAVAALTVAAVSGFGWHEHTLTVGTVLGPTLGAVVALLTVFGLRTVHRESERRGVLEERERLAREIHDTLAQGLSSIHLLLSAADGLISTDPSVAAGHVRKARAVAQENLDEARRFVRALSPADLADASLPAALHRLVERTSTDALRIGLTVSGDRAELPTAYDVALLRIAQAALANAVTHSGASRVALTLSYMDDEIALDVVDDGHGFSPGAVTGPVDGRGFGLAAMRSRTEQLGGLLAVESGPGEGTAVAVTFPLTRTVALR